MGADMEKFADKIEDLLQEKLICYQQLTDILEKEREVILAMDVGLLWQLSTKKNEMVRSVESLRNRILSLFDEHGIDHAMDLNSFRLSLLFSLVPGVDREKAGIEKAIKAIDAQKDEIQRLAAENKRYVNDYLGVIGDVISTIVKLTGLEQYKSPGRFCESKQSNHFIKAEV